MYFQKVATENKTVVDGRLRRLHWRKIEPRQHASTITGSGDILAERRTQRHTDILITILAQPLRGFTRRWMYPLLYHASGNHRGHCKPFNTNFSNLVYLQMYHHNSQRLNSPLTLSPINAKLTSISYVHASKSLVYLFLCQFSLLP